MCHIVWCCDRRFGDTWGRAGDVFPFGFVETGQREQTVMKSPSIMFGWATLSRCFSGSTEEWS